MLRLLAAAWACGRAAATSVAFVTPANANNAAPAVVALLRVRRFLPRAGLFIAARPSEHRRPSGDLTCVS